MICTGPGGSFKSGDVTASGTLTDGTLSVNLSNRGWSVFDLSTVPAGAVVDSVNFTFNLPSAPTGGGRFGGIQTPDLYGNISDFSSQATSNQGTSLYTNLVNGTVIGCGSWQVAAGTQTVSFDAAGVSFINNNIGGHITLGLDISASAASYVITGYNGNAPDQPTLTIFYSWPLSITLEDVSVTNQGGVNVVRWNTLTEDKTDAFEIERSSDARNFELIGRLDANGLASSYLFRDENAMAGMNYYRLKLKDASAENIYSRTVSATVNTQGSAWTVHPNPVNDVLNINLNSTPAENASVLLFDLSGKLILEETTTSSEIKINLGHLPTGAYFIKYLDAHTSRSTMINKN